MTEKRLPPGLKIEAAPCNGSGSATLTARLDGEILHLAKVDLEKPKARADFAHAVVTARPGIDNAGLLQELLRIAATTSAKPGEKRSESSSQELLMKMPDSVRARARTILESPNLIERIVDDVAACGVAGERELVAAIFLVAVSRLLPRPASGRIFAPSSIGKSHVLDCTAKLFPPEAVVRATAITPKALVYMPPGTLKHKFVVAGERSRRQDEETADGTRMLREMISGGKISQLVTVKVDGRMATERVEQDGPIAFIETTTLTKIFDEDANRCLPLPN